MTTPMVTTGKTEEIKAHIRKHGGKYSDWYVGIAANPRRRLFNDHNVSEKGDFWIYRKYPSDLEARYAEKRLLDLGCDGGEGGGDSNTEHVYAYKKAPHTVQ